MRHMGKSLEYDRGRRPSMKMLSGTPSSKCFTLDVQKDFGENERDKDNQHGVELALLGFSGQPINPTHLMINRWCCGNIGFGRSGCYLSMLAISLRPGITRNPNHLLPGLPQDLKKGKYIK
jgi:hypothetical protein